MVPSRLATGKWFIYVAIPLLLELVTISKSEIANDGRGYQNDDGKRLTREYHLRQGALRGLIVKPSRQYDLQSIEMFLGIPYAAPPLENLRFMPPVSAPPWSGVKMATRFAPVCPQMLPVIKKGNPPSLGRQHYLNRLKPFLARESEDCLYLNIYVPYREQKSKKFPVLVFIHGDSFEWSSGNPYDGRILSSYGNIMVITVNFRLGILGFLKPSITEHVYGNNGLLDQLAALQWIKDNIEDLNGDPRSVTLMGHGTGAACVNFLMLSPISNGLFHRAILMSGSALSDWAMTKDPTQYTLQVAQSLECNPTSKDLMKCLQNKPLSEIKKVQILAREFESALGPVVAGSFIPNEPAETMESFPNLLSKYQILSGVTEFERYHDFGVIELDHGVLENQRDDFITKYAKIVFDGAENVALKEILKEYSPSDQDPQRWSVEANRDVILNAFSDSRTLAPSVKFANYQARANRQSYFYVFGHNSISTDYAPLNKSVHGEDLPYVLGIPLGGANTHFHSEYTQKEKLLSEVMMRLWTNFVKIGSPNTQSRNEYYTLDRKQWNLYNVDWPEFNVAHQSYLKLDIPPHVSSMYRATYTKFWTETLPNKMKKYIVDPLFEFSPATVTQKPKTTHRNADPIRKTWTPAVSSPHYSFPAYGKMRPYSPPARAPITDSDQIYREIKAIKTPARHIDHPTIRSPSTTKPTPISTSPNIPVKTSGATITLIISLGILFLGVNGGICAALYYKRRKAQFQERALESTHHSRAEIGEVDMIGQKSHKDDKSALQSFKNGYTVIKSMNLKKIKRSSSKSKKSKPEPCKTPKSDDSGGFRERFQLRRHLSTSTLDAHTKVRDWITNEVMHRCSPNILTKSITDINEKTESKSKPFTRSEEILSDSKVSKKDSLTAGNVVSSKKSSTKYKARTSEKTTSTSALGSHSSINSNKQSLASTKHTGKSNDSLKSKGAESTKSKKVSVAIDATPSARTQSILIQEPIEISKSFDIDQTDSVNENKLLRSKTEGEIQIDVIEIKPTEKNENRKIFTNEITLSLEKQKPLKISHSHSRSDPVTDINYDILPPLTFRNDINVTSKEDANKIEPLTAAEALLTIQRRNFPKVLPDLPRTQKRLSLQPTSLQSFQSFRSYLGNIESQSERPKVPPQPPPRTTTLERRLAYKNSKPLSSFDTSNVKKIPEADFLVKNYENIDSLSPIPQATMLLTKSLERADSARDNLKIQDREYPKVIIASSNIPSSSQSSIFIKPSPSQSEVPSNVARVRVPDDFHSQSGSITSFSSFCSENDSDDDEDGIDFVDDIDDDKLLKELVGGVESPTNSEIYLDTKGPDSIYDKKQEIVPVKVNIGQNIPKNKEYVFISNLLLPDVTCLEKTAQIKPNFSLNKLKDRSESINRPVEKAVKVKHKRNIKPAVVLNKSFKGNRKSDRDRSDPSKLEHSNSGSSNDTETSTGTVKKIEIKKEDGKL